MTEIGTVIYYDINYILSNIYKKNKSVQYNYEHHPHMILWFWSPLCRRDSDRVTSKCWVLHRR